MKARANTSSSPAKVIPLTVVKKPRRKAEDKWSVPVMKFGFTTLPTLLFHAQGKLGITPVQFNVLLQLIEPWWDAGENPFPSKETIARRVNKSPRQVQRYLTELEDKKLIMRIPRYKGKNAQTSNEFSLAGLVQKLKEVEPEFSRAKQLKKSRTKALQEKVETAAAG